MIRKAISPRLAIKIFLICGISNLFDYSDWCIKFNSNTIVNKNFFNNTINICFDWVESFHCFNQCDSITSMNSITNLDKMFCAWFWGQISHTNHR